MVIYLRERALPFHCDCKMRRNTFSSPMEESFESSPRERSFSSLKRCRRFLGRSDLSTGRSGLAFGRKHDGKRCHGPYDRSVSVFLIPPFTSLILESVTVLLYAPPHFILSSILSSESRPGHVVLRTMPHVDTGKYRPPSRRTEEPSEYRHISLVPRKSIAQISQGRGKNERYFALGHFVSPRLR